MGDGQTLAVARAGGRADDPGKLAIVGPEPPMPPEDSWTPECTIELRPGVTLFVESLIRGGRRYMFLRRARRVDPEHSEADDLPGLCVRYDELTGLRDGLVAWLDRAEHLAPPPLTLEQVTQHFRDRTEGTHTWRDLSVARVVDALDRARRQGDDEQLMELDRAATKIADRSPGGSWGAGSPALRRRGQPPAAVEEILRDAGALLALPRVEIELLVTAWNGEAPRGFDPAGISRITCSLIEARTTLFRRSGRDPGHSCDATAAATRKDDTLDQPEPADECRVVAETMTGTTLQLFPFLSPPGPGIAPATEASRTLSAELRELVLTKREEDARCSREGLGRHGVVWPLPIDAEGLVRRTFLACGMSPPEVKSMLAFLDGRVDRHPDEDPLRCEDGRGARRTP